MEGDLAEDGDLLILGTHNFLVTCGLEDGGVGGKQASEEGIGDQGEGSTSVDGGNSSLAIDEGVGKGRGVVADDGVFAVEG